ncbi:MAG: hypothetical protein AAFO69_05440 [Bacteroidota bacterium]
MIVFSNGIAQEQYLQLNHVDTTLTYGQFANVYLNVPAPVIWSIRVTDNYSHQISVFSSSWDTLMLAPQGNPILYTFWRADQYGLQQITNLDNKTKSPLQVGVYSPIAKADTILKGFGSIKLMPLQSIEYFGGDFTTIRFTANDNQIQLIYCFIGSDSVIPLALNTSAGNLPPSFENIEGILAVNDDHFQLRGRWESDRIFIVYMPIISTTSITVEFFSG